MKPSQLLQLTTNLKKRRMTIVEVVLVERKDLVMVRNNMGMMKLKLVAQRENSIVAAELEGSSMSYLH